MGDANQPLDWNPTPPWEGVARTSLTVPESQAEITDPDEVVGSLAVGKLALIPAVRLPPVLQPKRASSERLRAGYAECLAVARQQARNFYYSFLVLPKAQRLAMCALYTFLRRTDDLGDDDQPLEQRRAALLGWRERLDSLLAGEAPRADWWLAFHDTIIRHEISPAHLHAVLDGVISDLDVSRYENFAALYRYCYQVASAVGLACIQVWGVRDARAALPAEWCGIAFQLTNVLRDIVEDLRLGRIYLPRNELRAFGVDLDVIELGDSQRIPSVDPLVRDDTNTHFLEFMHYQIHRARDYYHRAEALFDFVPPAGRAVLQVMVRVYGGLLREIERQPLEVLRRRVSLSKWRKLGFVLEALPTRYLGRAARGSSWEQDCL